MYLKVGPRAYQTAQVCPTVYLASSLLDYDRIEDRTGACIWFLWKKEKEARALTGGKWSRCSRPFAGPPPGVIDPPSIDTSAVQSAQASTSDRWRPIVGHTVH
eukprot:4604726-Pyramimonas_sp.AAC.2